MWTRAAPESDDVVDEVRQDEQQQNQASGNAVISRQPAVSCGGHHGGRRRQAGFHQNDPRHCRPKDDPRGQQRRLRVEDARDIGETHVERGGGKREMSDASGTKVLAGRAIPRSKHEAEDKADAHDRQGQCKRRDNAGPDDRAIRRRGPMRRNQASGQQARQ